MKRNAIILAAGMSSRFAPLSYEKPKGLLVVKGDVLIERLIRQLREAGISDITIVVGYRKEMFFYLEEKMHVDIVINDDYYQYNNPSSLIRVLDKLDNTYICSSDDYYTENVFIEQPIESYYAAQYSSGKSDEYCLQTDDNDTITEVTRGGCDSWYMIGHAYFNHAYSTQFCELLKADYATSECKASLWEDFYMRHLDVLHMQIKRYKEGTIYEFDSLDELRLFDPLYINNTDSAIMRNICSVLQCQEADIQDIHAIKQGLTNTSFYFRNTADGEQYVYRHPGVGTDDYINRKSEAYSMRYAQELGLDNTFIYMDEDEGWKISHYLDGCHTLDYHNEEEVNTAIKIMRKLHDANIHSSYDFGLWNKTLDFVHKVRRNGYADFPDFEELFSQMESLHVFTQADNIKPRLVHGDCYDPNFLIDKNGKMSLIDWEYSSNDDPGTDLGTFICCCADYTEENAHDIICRYLGGEPEPSIMRHYYAYVALAAYCWFVWAVYLNSIGNNVGEYLYLWYKMSKQYYNIAIALYQN